MFEVLSVVLIKIHVFANVTLYRAVKSQRRLGEAHCLHFAYYRTVSILPITALSPSCLLPHCLHLAY